MQLGDHLIDSLKKHGLECRTETYSDRPIAISGDTYRARNLLREAGGYWSKKSQCWRFDSMEQVQVLEAALSRAQEGGGAVGLAEAAGSFENSSPNKKTRWNSMHYRGHRMRLSQRFLDAGCDSLADYELLELLLFYSIDIRDTKPIAKAMLEQLGGLGGVLAADPERYRDFISLPSRKFKEDQHSQDLQITQILLKSIKALNERVLKEQIKEREVVSSWSALIDYLKVVMTHEPTEHFRILFLDRKNILIKDEVQSRGTVDHTPLYPREVVKRALELAASAIIMVHNHPSGDPTPSQADISMTMQVEEALKAVGITIHDHVIVGKNRHLSFKSEGLF